MAMHHFTIAAIEGHEKARHNLGVEEEKKGNLETRAIKHYILAAKAGYDDAMYQVKRGFMNGYVTKEDFEKTLRAYQKSLDEVKSEQRDKAEVVNAEIARENEFYAAITSKENEQ